MKGIRVRGLDRLHRDLRRMQGNLAYAAAQTANHLALAVRDAERREMERVFDRPTRWTLNSTRITYARKSRPIARVWLKDEAFKGTPATRYLAPQIFGGERSIKRFERALQHAGILPTGWLAVPGEAADLDAYGNMSRGQIVKILSWMGAFGEQGYRANITQEGRRRRERYSARKRGVGYFAVTPLRPDPRTAHLTPGVYKRTTWRADRAVVSTIEPVLVFVKSASYAPRYDFFGVAERTAAERLDEAAAKGFARAFA